MIALALLLIAQNPATCPDPAVAPTSPTSLVLSTQSQLQMGKDLDDVWSHFNTALPQYEVWKTFKSKYSRDAIRSEIISRLSPQFEATQYMQLLNDGFMDKSTQDRLLAKIDKLSAAFLKTNAPPDDENTTFVLTVFSLLPPSPEAFDKLMEFDKNFSTSRSTGFTDKFFATLVNLAGQNPELQQKAEDLALAKFDESNFEDTDLNNFRTLSPKNWAKIEKLLEAPFGTPDEEKKRIPIATQFGADDFYYRVKRETARLTILGAISHFDNPPSDILTHYTDYVKTSTAGSSRGMSVSPAFEDAVVGAALETDNEDLISTIVLEQNLSAANVEKIKLAFKSSEPQRCGAAIRWALIVAQATPTYPLTNMFSESAYELAKDENYRAIDRWRALFIVDSTTAEKPEVQATMVSLIREYATKEESETESFQKNAAAVLSKTKNGRKALLNLMFEFYGLSKNKDAHSNLKLNIDIQSWSKDDLIDLLPELAAFQRQYGPSVINDVITPYANSVAIKNALQEIATGLNIQTSLNSSGFNRALLQEIFEQGKLDSARLNYIQRGLEEDERVGTNQNSTDILAKVVHGFGLTQPKATDTLFEKIKSLRNTATLLQMLLDFKTRLPRDSQKFDEAIQFMVVNADIRKIFPLLNSEQKKQIVNSLPSGSLLSNSDRLAFAQLFGSDPRHESGDSHSVYALRYLSELKAPKFAAEIKSAAALVSPWVDKYLGADLSDLHTDTLAILLNVFDNQPEIKTAVFGTDLKRFGELEEFYQGLNPEGATARLEDLKKKR